jgi:hypothetical protein
MKSSLASGRKWKRPCSAMTRRKVSYYIKDPYRLLGATAAYVHHAARGMLTSGQNP